MLNGQLEFISLFAGIGGFDLAFKRAGMTCVAQVEIDDKARALLHRYWPDVPQFSDVRLFGNQQSIISRAMSYKSATWKNFNPVSSDEAIKIARDNTFRGRVDVVCGGFPCQDLSVAGKRLGFNGERSSLFFEMVRIVNELRPAFLVWENVPGLLSANHGRDFAAVLMALDHIGYHGAWTVLDAKFFGLAQRRRRVFGVFARADIGAGCCAEILSLAARLPGNSQSRHKARQDVAATIGGKLAKRSGNDGEALTVAAPLVSRQSKGSFTDPVNDNLIAFSSKDDGGDAGEGIAPTLRSMNYKESRLNGGGDHKRADRPNGGIYVNETDTALAVGSTDVTAIVTNAFNGYTGGSDDNDAQGNHLVAWEMSHADDPARQSGSVSPTLQQRMGTGGNQVPLVGVRSLTPVECERLQGFPDNWTNGQSDSVRYRQLGNAVAVPCVEWLGRRLVNVAQSINWSDTK